jgi:hypothetical protein
MALLDDIATFLNAQVTSGVYPPQGLVSGVNLFLGRVPAEAPDVVVLIQQYEGVPPTFTMGTQISAMEHPRIQIYVRGAREDYPNTYALAHLVRDTLAGYVVPDSTYFPNIARIEPLNIPNPMPYDELDRPSFTMNIEFHANADSTGMPIV